MDFSRNRTGNQYLICIIIWKLCSLSAKLEACIPKYLCNFYFNVRIA